MVDMIEMVVKIPTAVYEASQIIDAKHEDVIQIPLEVIKNGIPIAKGHGKIVDMGNIKKDMIESNNPIIGLSSGDEYMEVVSLDYLDSLQAIVEADKSEREVENE